MAENLRYDFETLRYAESLVERYHELKAHLEQIRIGIAYDSPGGGYVRMHIEGLVSDPTYNAAAKILQDKRVNHLAEIVAAIDSVYRRLSDEDQVFFRDYFWGQTIKNQTVETKRKRRVILSLLCFDLGLPSK